jgi:hypothetical protein
VGLDEEQISQIKLDKADIFLARFLYASACIKKCEDQLRRKAHELRSGLRLTVGSANIYCDL